MAKAAPRRLGRAQRLDLVGHFTMGAKLVLKPEAANPPIHFDDQPGRFDQPGDHPAEHRAAALFRIACARRW